MQSVRHNVADDDTLDTQAVYQPLQILVTQEARQALALRQLVRQALPMLRRPEAFSTEQRQHIAKMLTCALEGDEEEPDTKGGEWP